MNRSTRTVGVLLLTLIMVTVEARSSRKLCGKKLINALSIVCMGRGYNWQASSKRSLPVSVDKKASSGIANECCEVGCTFQQLESYCADPSSSITSPAAAEHPVILGPSEIQKQNRKVPARLLGMLGDYRKTIAGNNPGRTEINPSESNLPQTASGLVNLGTAKLKPGLSSFQMAAPLRSRFSMLQSLQSARRFQPARPSLKLKDRLPAWKNRQFFFIRPSDSDTDCQPGDDDCAK